MSLVLKIGLIAVLSMVVSSSEDQQVLDARDRRLKLRHSVLFFQGKPFSGITLQRLDNGRPKEMRSFADGRKHGLQFRWFPDGQMLWQSLYRNGERQGHQFGWHGNGEKRFQSDYRDGKREGEQWSWHPNGRLASYQLIQGDEERVYKQWRPDGKIFTNYIRKNDEKFGIEGNEACQAVQPTTLSRTPAPAFSRPLQE